MEITRGSGTIAARSEGQQPRREGEGSGCGQVKLLPAPQLLPLSTCQVALVWVG